MITGSPPEYKVVHFREYKGQRRLSLPQLQNTTMENLQGGIMTTDHNKAVQTARRNSSYNGRMLYRRSSLYQSKSMQTKSTDMEPKMFQDTFKPEESENGCYNTVLSTVLPGVENSGQNTLVVSSSSKSSSIRLSIPEMDSSPSPARSLSPTRPRFNYNLRRSSEPNALNPYRDLWENATPPSSVKKFKRPNSSVSLITISIPSSRSNTKSISNPSDHNRHRTTSTKTAFNDKPDNEEKVKAACFRQIAAKCAQIMPDARRSSMQDISSVLSNLYKFRKLTGKKKTIEMAVLPQTTEESDEEVGIFRYTHKP